MTMLVTWRAPPILSVAAALALTRSSTCEQPTINLLGKILETTLVLRLRMLVMWTVMA